MRKTRYKSKGYAQMLVENYKEFYEQLQGQQQPKASADNPVYTRDTTHFDGSKFPYGISGSERVVSLDHRALRLNSRDAYHDVPQATAIVEQKANITIDRGLFLDPTPQSLILGRSDEELQVWSENVAARFHLWANNDACMLDRGSNLYQAQRLMAVSETRDGEYFIRLHYNDDPDLLNPLQLQFIDAGQIDGNAYTSTDGYQYNQDGIHRDNRGRETAYDIIITNSKGVSQTVTVPRISSDGKRILMIHAFKSLFAGQTRGLSALSHCLQELQDITTFSQAHLHKAINQASHVAYVKPSKDAPASDAGFGDITGRYAQPHDIFGSDPSLAPVGQTPLPLGDMIDCKMLPEARISVPGSSMIFGLKGGEDLGYLKDTTPHENYDAFVDSFMSYLGASTGMPIEVLLMRFNENYSASRATLILAWRIAEIERMQKEADALNPIYHMWLAGEIAANRILAPGWLDPILRQAWLSTNWIGAPMPQIDPAKQAKANKDYLEMGATTLNRVARELNGSNYRDNQRTLSKEIGGLPSMPWSKSNGGSADREPSR